MTEMIQLPMPLWWRVAHQEFIGRPLADYAGISKQGACFVDVKSQFNADTLCNMDFSVWRL